MPLPEPVSGPFASLDQMAGNSALDLATLVREVLQEQTDLDLTDLAATAPVTLVAGSAVAMTVTAVDGTEYEMFVREKP